jgi:ABC-type glycerol-3-phosphate transport system substrate-binding protein
MRRRKNIAVVVLGMLIAMLLSASMAEALTKVAFLGRSNQNLMKPIREIVGRFNQANAGQVQVDILEASAGSQVLEQLGVLRLSGDSPDIVFTAVETLDMIMNGMIVPVDPFVAKDPKWLDDFFPDVVDTLRLRGKLWGVPIGFSMSWGILYNQSLLDSAALPTPPEGWNWDDFVALGKKLTHDTDGDGTPEIWGAGSHDNNVWWDGWLLQNRSTFFDWDRSEWLPEPTRAVEALEFHASLIRDHRIAPRQNPLAIMQQGKVGLFAIQAPDIPFTLRAGIGLERDLRGTHLPVQGSRKMQAKSWSLFLANTGDAKRTAAAWEFMKFALEPDNLLTYSESAGHAPPRRSIIASRQYMNELRQYRRPVH